MTNINLLQQPSREPSYSKAILIEVLYQFLLWPVSVPIQIKQENKLQYSEDKIRANNLNIESAYFIFIMSWLAENCHILLYSSSTYMNVPFIWKLSWNRALTGPRSAVDIESDCRSRCCEFDSGPVPYSCGDWSWKKFYGHSPSADSKRVCCSYKQKHVHKVLVNRLVNLACPGKSVVTWTDHLDMTIAVDWDVKPQPNKQSLPKFGVNWDY